MTTSKPRLVYLKSSTVLSCLNLSGLKRYKSPKNCLANDDFFSGIDIKKAIGEEAYQVLLSQAGSYKFIVSDVESN